MSTKAAKLKGLWRKFEGVVRSQEGESVLHPFEKQDVFS